MTTIRRYSDSLLIKLLQGHMPEKSRAQPAPALAANARAPFSFTFRFNGEGKGPLPGGAPLIEGKAEAGGE